jgi:hypothetical protein
VINKEHSWVTNDGACPMHSLDELCLITVDDEELEEAITKIKVV